MMSRHYPKTAVRTALAACGLFLTFSGVGLARIGETQPQIEKRLYGAGGAVRVYENNSNNQNNRRGGRGGNRSGNNNDDLEERVAALEAAQGTAGFAGFSMENIYMLLGQASGSDNPRTSDFAEYRYFKTDDGTMPPEGGGGGGRGWVYIVYMYKGVSVLEIYRRAGRSLAEVEIQQLLDLNLGHAKSWRSLSVRGSSDGGSSSGSYLGYQHEREDGQIRAFRSGNDLVMFNASLDQKLAEIEKRVSESESGGGQRGAAAAVKEGMRGF